MPGTINGNNNQVTINITDSIPPDNFATVDKNGMVGNTYTKEQDNVWRKSVEENVNSGIKGVAKPNDIVPATGFFRMIVDNANIYTNYLDESNTPITITAQDINIVNGVQKNEVIIEVNNGISKKKIYSKVGADGANGTAEIPNYNPALSYVEKSTVVKDNSIWRVINGQTANVGDVPGLSDKWISLGGNTASEVDKTFDEAAFSQVGLYEDTGDTSYKNTGKFKISAGAILTARISGDNPWNPKVAAIIVIKNGVVIDRKYTGSPNTMVTLTYIASEDVEIVINHRVAAFSTGYYYHLFYKPFYGMKDLNTTGGVLGFDIYKNAIYSTKAFTVEDDYVFKKGQVLNNGQFEAGTGIEYRTDYLPIKAGETVKVDATLGANALVVSFWSLTKTLISGISGNDQPNTYTFTAPQDGYVIIGSMLRANYIGNFQGINVPVESLKLIAENNIDAPLGVSSSLTGATKKGFEMPKTLPENGILSIIDDDGNADVISYLFPLLKSKNIPLGLAIAGGLIEGGSFAGAPLMTSAQLISLKDEPLIEIMNHTFSHIPMNVASKNVIYGELYRNHNWLLERGILAESFVSPYGVYNTNTMECVFKLYDSHYSTLNQLSNLNNFRNLEIGRIGFGNGVSVQSIKNAIDQAKAKNQYLVIMTHVNGADRYPNWRADFEQIVDYIVASGITVAKPTDAFNRIRNKFERYGDYKIGADGMRRKY